MDRIRPSVSGHPVELTYIAGMKHFAPAVLLAWYDARLSRSVRLAEQLAPLIPNGKYILLPESEMTRGHGSHTWAVLWKDHLKALLEATAPPPAPVKGAKPVAKPSPAKPHAEAHQGH